MRDSLKSRSLRFLLVSLIVTLLSVSVAHGARVAYYSFDGHTLDLSGTGNDGTLINGADLAGDSPFGFGQSLALQNGGGNMPGNAS